MKSWAFVFLSVFLFMTACSTVQGPSGPAQPKPGVGIPKDIGKLIGMGAAADKWKTTCGIVPQEVAGLSVNYCVSETAPNPKQTIYYTHGLASSEKVFLNAKSVISFLNDPSSDGFAAGLPPSMVVTFGWSSALAYACLLAPDGVAKTTVPTNCTVANYKKLMAWVASQYTLPQPYFLVGQSMGGSNAAMLATQMPDVFKKVVITSPMLVDCDPFRFGACPLTLLGPSMVVKGQYQTSAQWSKANPFAQLALAKKLPPMLVLYCKNDEFGLGGSLSGAAWVKKAKAKGHNVEGVMDARAPNPCHMGWDYKKALAFIGAP